MPKDLKKVVEDIVAWVAMGSQAPSHKGQSVWNQGNRGAVSLGAVQLIVLIA